MVVSASNMCREKMEDEIAIKGKTIKLLLNLVLGRLIMIIIDFFVDALFPSISSSGMDRREQLNLSYHF